MNTERLIVERNGRILLFPRMPAGSDLDRPSAEVNPYAQTELQQYPLGTKLIEGDRVWRYVKNGAGTLTAAMIVQGPAEQNTAASKDIVVDAVSAVGDDTVSLTSQAAIVVAANYYKEGYLWINDEAGEGIAYKIKSHAAFVGTTAGSVFTLFDPIATALTVASQVGLRKNLYDMVIAAAAGLTNVPVGVSQKLVTAAYYGWIQTGGPCAVNAKVAVSLGGLVFCGITSGQADKPAHDATLGITASTAPIGFAMVPGVADGEHFLVFLTLDR